MLRNIVFGLVTLCALFAFSITANASEAKILQVNVTIATDGSAQFEEKLTIKNTDANDLVSELYLAYPFDISSPTVALDNGQQTTIITSNRQIKIANLQNLIPFGQERQMTVRFGVAGLVKENGVYKNMYLPKIHNTSYQLNLTIAKELGTLSYQSSNSLTVSDVGTSYQIASADSRDVYLSFGNATSITFSGKWRFDQGDARYKLPFPNFDGHNLVFTKKLTQSAGDNKGISYIKIDASDLEQTVGEYAGVIMPVRSQQFAQGREQKGFLNNPQSLGLQSQSNAQLIFDELVAKFNPAESYDFAVRKRIEEINISNADPLDYSTALTGALRANGIDARIVFGLIHNKQTQEEQWHFWVQYLPQNEVFWKDIDPYLADATGWDFFYNTDQQRLPFGTLHEEQNVNEFSLGGYEKLELNFSNADVAGTNTGVNVLVDMPEKASAGSTVRARLLVENTGNIAMNITKVEFAGHSLKNDFLQTVVILPGKTQVLDMPITAGHNPLAAGEKNLAGKVTVLAGSAEQSVELQKNIFLEINRSLLMVNALIIFICAFTFVVYMRYLLSKHAIKHIR